MKTKILLHFLRIDKPINRYHYPNSILCVGSHLWLKNILLIKSNVMLSCQRLYKSVSYKSYNDPGCHQQVWKKWYVASNLKQKQAPHAEVAPHVHLTAIAIQKPFLAYTVEVPSKDLSCDVCAKICGHNRKSLKAHFQHKFS